MSTRANIYITDKFITSVRYDAYPNSQCWEYLQLQENSLQASTCMGLNRLFKKAVIAMFGQLPKDVDWDFEIVWSPVLVGNLYEGILLVRRVDHKLTFHPPKGRRTWLVPGPLRLMSDYVEEYNAEYVPY